jgi:Tfp pilus assembly protein PilE
MNVGAHRTKGLTLIEMTLVIATIALLIGFGVPAVRALIHSFQSEDGRVELRAGDGRHEPQIYGHTVPEQVHIERSL